jgi:hypothetical protein
MIEGKWTGSELCAMKSCGVTGVKHKVFHDYRRRVSSINIDLSISCETCNAGTNSKVPIKVFSKAMCRCGSETVKLFIVSPHEISSNYNLQRPDKLRLQVLQCYEEH